MIDAINGANGLTGLAMPVHKSHRHHPNPFQAADKNNDGSLDKTEVQGFLDQIKQKTGKSIDLTQFMSALDSNGDGVIDAKEFAAGKDKAKELLGTMASGAPQSNSFMDVLQQLTNNPTANNSTSLGQLLQNNVLSQYTQPGSASAAGGSLNSGLNIMA